MSDNDEAKRARIDYYAMRAAADKGVVRKKIAKGLGIACFILLISLIGTLVIYNMTVNDKNEQLTELDQQLANSNQQIALMNSQKERLLGYVNDLGNSLNLTNSTIWLGNITEGIPSVETDYYQVANYAGYVKVEIDFSQQLQFPIIIEVLYSAYGVSYEKDTSIRTNATLVFSVLPGEITIKTINSHWNYPSAPSYQPKMTFTYTYCY